jgi:hypothetical protein
MMQTNPHGLPMPPTWTALLVAAVVGSVCAVALLAMGFVAAAVLLGGIAILCAVLGLARRPRGERIE